jgi:signal transduction histidine kinase
MARPPRFVLPWLTGLLVAGILVGTWSILRQAESRALELSTRVASRQAAPRLADYVAARLTVVASLARERAQHDDMSTEDFIRRAQRLAGGVAHDFNNLLTAMIGHAELAKRDKNVPERVQKDLEVILDAALRGAKITRDLLTFSRREVVHPRAMDVSKEVEQLVPMLEHLLREDVSLEVDLDPTAGSVRMDPSQLERALMNLVVNAVDAQPDGGRVRIAVSRGDDSIVRVAVTDEGDGMSEEIATRAFEPFFTTKPAGKGTGLGLASVYGMARQAGGDVALDSAPGKGTTLTLLLPRVTDTDDRAPERANVVASTNRQKVLLAEDLIDESQLEALDAKFLQKPYAPNQLLKALAELAPTEG